MSVLDISLAPQQDAASASDPGEAKSLEETAVVRGKEVVELEAEGLRVLAQSIGGTMAEAFEQACSTILKVTGRVIVTGMGKSGHIARKWAATLAATGTPSSYVHPAEAAHGDLGMLVTGDALIVISNSGNTGELAAFLRYAKSIAVPVIGVASKANSLVMKAASTRLLLPAMREACHANIAPTTSTTMQLALGDAIAMAVMDMRGFSKDGMQTLHPGGSIGLRLTPVRNVMHTDGLPLVDEATAMREVVLTMTSSGFGIAGVTDSQGRLIGVITDGDLRRHFESIADATAGETMTHSPKILPASTLAEDALSVMTENKINCAFVVEEGLGENGVPVGVVHLHDFLRIGLS